MQLTRVREFCLKILRYREILREALYANAHSVVLCHNHPGRTPRLSTSDLEATREIVRRLNAADISLDDHIVVVGGTKAISFAESGIDLGYRNSGFRVKERKRQYANAPAKKP